MKARLSIIICCYNSAARLPRTFEGLRHQQTQALAWEVILVDNNSSDATRSVAEGLLQGLAVPGRVVEEKTPGLMAAREAGMRAASGEVFLFCDDDNYLYPNFLQVCMETLDRHPEVAILGAYGKAVSEVPLPEWLGPLHDWFACAEPPEDPHPVPSRSVPGAGMAVRRSLYLELTRSGFVSALSDRKGNALSSGGDTELCFAAQVLGWQVSRHPLLGFEHYMPEQRLTLDYGLRLAKGLASCRPVISQYAAALAQGRTASPWPDVLLEILMRGPFGSLKAMRMAGASGLVSDRLYLASRVAGWRAFFEALVGSDQRKTLARARLNCRRLFETRKSRESAEADPASGPVPRRPEGDSGTTP